MNLTHREEEGGGSRQADDENLRNVGVVDGACTVHGRNKKIHVKFWSGNLKVEALMECSLIRCLLYIYNVTLWIGFICLGI